MAEILSMYRSFNIYTYFFQKYSEIPLVIEPFSKITWILHCVADTVILILQEKQLRLHADDSYSVWSLTKVNKRLIVNFYEQQDEIYAMREQSALGLIKRSF